MQEQSEYIEDEDSLRIDGNRDQGLGPLVDHPLLLLGSVLAAENMMSILPSCSVERDRSNRQTSWCSRDTPRSEHLTAVFKVCNPAFTIIPDTDNAGSESRDKLYCSDATHRWFVEFFDRANLNWFVRGHGPERVDSRNN
jgi:hypothetical protein